MASVTLIFGIQTVCIVIFCFVYLIKAIMQVYKLNDRNFTLFELKYKIIPRGKKAIEQIKKRLITNFGVSSGFQALIF